MSWRIKSITNKSAHSKLNQQYETVTVSIFEQPEERENKRFYWENRGDAWFQAWPYLGVYMSLVFSFYISVYFPIIWRSNWAPPVSCKVENSQSKWEYELQKKER